MLSVCQECPDGPDCGFGADFSVVLQTAKDLASTSAAVLLLNGTCIEARYWWNEAVDAAFSAPKRLTAGPELLEALIRGGEAVEGSVTARFLNQAESALPAPASSSFLLFARPIRKCVVVIAFGFPAERPSPAALSPAATDVLSLAAFVTWSVRQLDRLQAELRITNEKLAALKLVERAKSLLQSELQLDEQRAYEHLRRTSRQRRIPIATLAGELLWRAASTAGKRTVTE